MEKTKFFFMCFFIIIVKSSFASNTIIAVVNDIPISLYSIQDELVNKKSNEEIINIVNHKIDTTLQLQKALELNLFPSENTVNEVLMDTSKNNNVSMEKILNFDEINLIKKTISEQISILNLQRFITKNLKKPEEKIQAKCTNIDYKLDEKQIKIAQIIISEIDSDIKDPKQKNLLIKSFLNKLTSHISKGASFKAFAKLHSQHPSYKDGGVTDWLTVNNPTLKILDSLGKNEVSEIYSTIYGLAIAIKIDERYISSKLQECEEKVIYQNAEMYYTDWLNNLREQAFIEIYYDKLK